MGLQALSDDLRTPLPLARGGSTPAGALLPRSSRRGPAAPGGPGRRRGAPRLPRRSAAPAELPAGLPRLPRRERPQEAREEAPAARPLDRSGPRCGGADRVAAGAAAPSLLLPPGRPRLAARPVGGADA